MISIKARITSDYSLIGEELWITVEYTCCQAVYQVKFTRDNDEWLWLTNIAHESEHPGCGN